MPPASGQDQMKAQGLAFGHTLLRAFKAALLLLRYSVEPRSPSKAWKRKRHRLTGCGCFVCYYPLEQRLTHRL